MCICMACISISICALPQGVCDVQAAGVVGTNNGIGHLLVTRSLLQLVYLNKAALLYLPCSAGSVWWTY